MTDIFNTTQLNQAELDIIANALSRWERGKKVKYKHFSPVFEHEAFSRKDRVNEEAMCRIEAAFDDGILERDTLHHILVGAWKHSLSPVTSLEDVVAEMAKGVGDDLSQLAIRVFPVPGSVFTDKDALAKQSVEKVSEVVANMDGKDNHPIKAVAEPLANLTSKVFEDLCKDTAAKEAKRFFDTPPFVRTIVEKLTATDISEIVNSESFKRHLE